MRKINIQELRGLQLNILQRVHNFCMSHEIHYSLAYGTLLGAVRHGGYIPWDDDIDIAMLRPDYERLRHEFKDEYLHFCDCRDDENMIVGFGKIEDTRTVLVEGGAKERYGVNIDVFPIDDLCDTFDESFAYSKSFNLNRLIRLSKLRPLSLVKKWWKKPIIALLKFLFLPVSSHKLNIAAVEKAIKHVNSTSQYVGLVTDFVFGYQEIQERRIWTEFAPIEFEKHEFMAVKDYDAYLTRVYGDYMTLPPKEQQIPKHDFDDIYWK